MGNSISGGGGTNGGRPINKYPLTINANELKDGHYVCFYTGLDIEKINNICKSMESVASITDLTIIINSARSNKKTIDKKYTLTSVSLNDDEQEKKTDTVTDSNNTNDNTLAAATDTATNTDNKTDTKNEYGIEINDNYYLLISSSLLQSANKNEIILKRSINNNYIAKILIGTQNQNNTSVYFDAYITNDFKTMLNSSNPANVIKQMRIFTELPAVSSIYFNFSTLQLQYSSRYYFVSVCEVNKLNNIMPHIESVRNNANVMGIYYFSKPNSFLQDAFNIFTPDEQKLVVETKDYTIFSIGNQTMDTSKKTVGFKGRTINLNSGSNANYWLYKTQNDGYQLRTESIKYGYVQGKRLFSNGAVDNVTQIFQGDQTINLNRTDFQLYIGYIKPVDEIDIIGTILNSTNIPTQKFIYYCSTDVLKGFKNFPKGIYAAPENGITNIANLEEGVNVSNDYLLTMSFKKESDTTSYDIVNPHGSALALKTLRKNQIVTKSALIGTHAGDMKSNGAYIPDSELILPSTFESTDKILVITALDTSPAAVWNMARNLVFKKGVKNWVLYFSLLPTFNLGEFDDFTLLEHDNKMKILYYKDSGFVLNSLNSTDFNILKDDKKILLISQQYINESTRKEYLSAATIYPGKATSSLPEYQQYKYNIVKNLSYIDYGISELSFELNEMFIGGVSNNINIYSNLVKAEAPVVDLSRLTGTNVMYFDYFPTIKNIDEMNSYLDVFKDIMTRGSNNKIIKYTCLMRVRKEWIKTKKPDPLFFEIIEGVNPDYALIFLFGGTNTRYTYNSVNKTFTLDKFQSIIFNTEMAKSSVPSERDVYLEDQLEAIIKPSDSMRYINIPLNTSTVFQQNTITTYNPRDNLSCYLSEYKPDNNSVILNGSVIQKDMSFSRLTFVQDYWNYIIYFLTEIRTSLDKSNTTAILFLNISDLSRINIEINSLTTGIDNYLKKPEESPYANFSTIYDKDNKLYTVSNIDVTIGKDAEFYSFLYDKMYIKSNFKPSPSQDSNYYLLLDMLQNKFIFSDSSAMFTNVAISVKTSSVSKPIEYVQVDRAARRTNGVTVDTDNTFWNSIRSFAFIDDLSKFEVNNLIEMMKYISVSLNGFFIISLVSYDTTSVDTWSKDRCVIIRGNVEDTVNISYKGENKKYYYVVLTDSKYKTSYMKFGIWNSEVNMESSDLTDIDFIINKMDGLPYDTKFKINTNERVHIEDAYFKFNLPRETQNSFPKFLQFTTYLNKYILFARPVDKNLIPTDMVDFIAVLEITLTDNSDEFDFSEIINFVVQWRTMTKNQLKRVLINTVNKSIKKPDKEYKIIIDQITYTTEDFVFTDNDRVLIYPKIDYDNLAGAWALDTNVFYAETVKDNQPSDSVYYSGPGRQEGGKIKVSVGADSEYMTGKETNLTQINMQMYIHDIVMKK